MKGTGTPVDLKGVCEGSPAKPLTQHQLEDVTSLDVLLGRLHSSHVLLLRHVAVLRCVWSSRQRHCHLPPHGPAISCVQFK